MPVVLFGKFIVRVTGLIFCLHFSFVSVRHDNCCSPDIRACPWGPGPRRERSERLVCAVLQQRFTVSHKIKIQVGGIALLTSVVVELNRYQRVGVFFREAGQGTTEEHQKVDFAKVLEEKEKGVSAKAIGGEPLA